jgi:ketose-bisphosphate aldolase
MPLISLAAGLEHARENRYALGAFNVLDSHFLRALFAAAKQERSPFIINIAEVHFKYLSLDSLVEAVKFEAARHDIPVVLNLDHGLHFEAVVRALRLGFSSVMFDGSTLSYEENIRQTREVVKMCHAVGVSVEAELGAVGGDEGGALYGHADEAFFTDPQLAREFVNTKASRNSTFRVWTPSASKPACRWCCTVAPGLATPISAAPLNSVFTKSISTPGCRRPRWPRLSSASPIASQFMMSSPSCC